MMTRNKILEDLAALQEEVVKKYHIRIIGLFGSYARGNEKESSDIDILVEPGAEADIFDLAGASVYLQKKLGHNVDVVSNTTLRKELKGAILNEVIHL